MEADAENTDTVKKKKRAGHARRPSLFSRHRTEEFRVEMRKEDQLALALAETRDAMRTNLDRVVERGEALNALDSKSQELELVGTEFRGTARKLKRVVRCQYRRILAIAACVVFIIVTAILAGLWVRACTRAGRGEYWYCAASAYVLCFHTDVFGSLFTA